MSVSDQASEKVRAAKIAEIQETMLFAERDGVYDYGPEAREHVRYLLALAAELVSLKDALERKDEALDALRWRNNDGSYVDGCWCDVKATDCGPDWHSPSCAAAREALGRQA